MAISRLAISNPGATTDTLLYTADRSSLASIIATNKASTVAEVRVWVIPTGQDATPANWSYIAYDADITATNSLETFRFPVMSGDKIYVRSTTADVSFQIMGIYETGADTYVYAQATQPTAPQIGDIWVDTASNVPSIDNTTVYRWSKTATGGETSLSGAGDDSSTLQYIAGYEQVYLNGVLLAKGLDYTASNGTSITSLLALTAGDIVEIISPYAIELTDVYTKSVSDSKYQYKVANGLNLVVPTSVTGGTVTANGQISFSGATSVDVVNCFTSTYDAYRILISVHAAAGGPLLAMYFRDNTPLVSTGYYGGAYNSRFDGVNGSTAMNNAGYITVVPNMGSIAANRSVASLDLYRTSTDGVVTGSAFAGSSSSTVNISANRSGMTNFNGFTISPGSSTMTGTIRIYGYNNGGA